MLISCLDVLCRANANVIESDPKLAADISQAIEALSQSLNTKVAQEETEQYRKKDNASKYVAEYDDDIVDVLTNKIIYKQSK